MTAFLSEIHSLALGQVEKAFSKVGFSPKSLYFCLILVLISGSNFSFAKSLPNAEKLIETGRRIYQEGILPNGKALIGKRANSVQVDGGGAACENCHRRSGMGSLEGNIVSPPISGQYLFTKQEDRPRILLNPQAPSNVNKPRASYDEKAFARAIRQGIRVDGQQLNSLMPHYDLSAGDLKALIAYLNQLSAKLPPGVGKDTLTFATVIAPGVEPAKRDVLIKMMNAAFNQRNASQEEHSGRMRMPIDLIPRIRRNWVLKVWDLTGVPEIWGKQLLDYYQKEPVFAIVSGLGNDMWNPVHDFCQTQKLPCLLPSAMLLPEKNDFYSLYYSRGITLEADVLAQQLQSKTKDPIKRLTQIYLNGSAGESAAQKLSVDLKDYGILVENRIFINDPEKAKTLLENVSKNDAIVLWLNPDDQAILGKVIVKPPALTYISGYLTDEHFNALPKSWHKDVRVIYPYELGTNRQKSDAALKSWLSSWRLPVVDMAFQSEVFFNLLFLTDMVSQMLDNLYQDYMIEKAEDMLSTGTNYSAYPHLGLSRGQRFASKGAYIARFNEDGSLVADSDWLVP